MSFGRQELGLPSRQAGKRWVNRAEFLLHCDAMVMPRRMGEGKREERKRGSARSEALETCREEGEGAQHC